MTDGQSVSSLSENARGLVLEVLSVGASPHARRRSAYTLAVVET